MPPAVAGPAPLADPALPPAGPIAETPAVILSRLLGQLSSVGFPTSFILGLDPEAGMLRGDRAGASPEARGIDRLIGISDARFAVSIDDRYNAIARACREARIVSAPTVHERVKRLESRGFVRRYSAQLDGKLLGFGLVAFVSCFTSAATEYDEFTERVGALPEASEVNSVAGEETFLLKVTTWSTTHPDVFLSRPKHIPGVQRTKTTIVCTNTFERGGIALTTAEKPHSSRLRSVGRA